MGKRNRLSAATVTPTPDAHGFHRSWTGGVGECGVECICGLIFDGFNTVQDARNEAWAHYLDSIPHPAWCDRGWCGEGGGDLHGTVEHRIELPDDGSISTWLHERHGDPADRGVMVSVDCSHGFAGLTVEQAAQLRDALDAVVATATGGPTRAEEIAEAFRVGQQIGGLQQATSWEATNRKPRRGTAGAVNPRPAAKSTDCKVPAQRLTARVAA